jgi:ACS family tartrate transporter-like MFS transporter
MISWGIIAGSTALVTGTMTFTVVRFLLGAAEAGFFSGPAIIMPASSRAL